MLGFIVSPVVAPTAISFMCEMTQSELTWKLWSRHVSQIVVFLFCFFKYPQMQILYRSIDAFDNLAKTSE